LNRLKSRDQTKFKEAGWTRDGIQSQPLKPTSMLFGPHAVVVMNCWTIIFPFSDAIIISRKFISIYLKKKTFKSVDGYIFTK